MGARRALLAPRLWPTVLGSAMMPSPPKKLTVSGRKEEGREEVRVLCSSGDEVVS